MKHCTRAAMVGMGVLLFAFAAGAGQLTISNVYASSAQVAAGNNNPVGNAVDGDITTRWAASDASYPQWFLMDLGSIKKVDSMSVAFYSPTTRTYTYSISSSPDSGVFTVVVGSKSSSTNQYTRDSIGITARYVRIDFSAVSNGTGYASIWEAQVYGSAVTGVAHQAARPVAANAGSGMIVQAVDKHTLTIANKGQAYDFGIYSLDGRCISRANGSRPQTLALPCRNSSKVYYLNGTLGGRQVTQAIMAP